MARTFADAVKALDSVIPRKPPANAPGSSPAQLSNEQFMRDGFEKLGITTEDMSGLRFVHIAGTKGKGSTGCMCESVFRAAGLRTALYTSPHILDVTERIRIDGAPVAEEKFARYFFDVWDVLEAGKSGAEDTVLRASFFRLLTLVAVHCFVQEKPDVVILEVGMGGTIDATNFVADPVVSGITHIGYDHVEVLGHTLTLIAREKAGIARKGVPCLIAPNQDPEAQLSLEARAGEADAVVSTVPAWDALPGSEGVVLGLEGEHQKQNAALAVALCQVWFERTRDGGGSRGAAVPYTAVQLSDVVQQGLQDARWAGRCQTVVLAHGKLRLRIDGAHTDQSIRAARDWFLSVAPEPSACHLLFQCLNRGGDSATIMKPLAEKTGAFAGAHFAPLLSSKGSIYASSEVAPEALAWVAEQKSVWEGVAQGTPAAQYGTLTEAVEALMRLAEGIDKGIDVLVTGSLYLVGDVLKLAKTKQQ